MKISEGRTDIVKDPVTGAVINVDSDAHRAAVESSKLRQHAKDQINANTNDINSIKEELSDIKHPMRCLLGTPSENGRKNSISNRFNVYLLFVIYSFSTRRR